MLARTLIAGVAAASVGLNVYQWFTNRGLKVMLRDAGVSTEDKCKILKKAMDQMTGEYDTLKKGLGDLIDDITAGKIPNDQIGERVLDLYRKASKADAKPTQEAPKDDAPETPAPEASASPDQK